MSSSQSVFVFATILTAAFGLVIGSFLNVVIYRVPAGISLLRESRCPECSEPVRPWNNIPVASWLILRGRCPYCRTAISARYPLVEIATSVAFVVVMWVALASALQSGVEVRGGAAVVAAYLYLAAVSVVLTMIDLDTHRLPNQIVLPSYVVAGTLFAVACLLGESWGALLRAVIAGAALYAFYFALRLIRPGGMGGGDVKLAGVLGMYLGWIGWGALVVGGFAAFVYGGLFGTALLVSRRAGRRSAIPFGPWMLAGAWTGILAGEAVARIYVNALAA